MPRLHLLHQHLLRPQEKDLPHPPQEHLLGMLLPNMELRLRLLVPLLLPTQRLMLPTGECELASYRTHLNNSRSTGLRTDMTSTRQSSKNGRPVNSSNMLSIMLRMLQLLNLPLLHHPHRPHDHWF